jgi:hypothetical protein
MLMALVPLYAILVPWAGSRFLDVGFLILFSGFLFISGLVAVVGLMATQKELKCPKCHREVRKPVKGRCPHCAVKLRSDGDLQLAAKLRWYRLGLQMLVVFVVIASVGVSWLGARLTQARKNRQVLAKIQRIRQEMRTRGGSLSISYGRSNWLGNLFGDPGFVCAEQFQVVDRSKFGDEDIVALRELTYLKRLDLSNSQITDAGLVHVEELSMGCPIWELYLSGTDVTDSGLVHLQKLDSLSELHLGSTQITDDGLVHLKALTDLRTLDLRYTGITDSGLQHLQGLAGLQSLVLVRTQVTDEGVKRLQQALPNCKIRQ